MFLTKKSGPLPHKPKTTVKNRPLGGWEDDEQVPKQAIQKQTLPQSHFQQVNLLEETQDPILSQEIQKQTVSNAIQNLPKDFVYYDWDTLNDRSDMDCQKKLVEDLVQTGGIRIKPNETQLSGFLKQIKGMETNKIGSLLLSKLEVNYNFQVKAKALYTIEHLIKKDEEYRSYFQEQSEKIRDFPEPEDNIENYRKIQKNVLSSIGIQMCTADKEDKEEKKTVYFDPHYCEEPKKSDIITFIEENANKVKKGPGKKPIIGPGQAKIKLLEKKEHQTQKNTSLFKMDVKEDNFNDKSKEVIYESKVKENSGNLLDLGSLEPQKQSDDLI